MSTSISVGDRTAPLNVWRGPPWPISAIAAPPEVGSGGTRSARQPERPVGQQPGGRSCVDHDETVRVLRDGLYNYGARVVVRRVRRRRDSREWGGAAVEPGPHVGRHVRLADAALHRSEHVDHTAASAPAEAGARTRRCRPGRCRRCCALCARLSSPQWDPTSGRNARAGIRPRRSEL